VRGTTSQSTCFTYKSTINDNAYDAMRSDVFMVTLISGWHPVIEGSKRLLGEK